MNLLSRVTASDANCGLDQYDAGTSIGLTVIAAEGFAFAGWSGDLAGDQSPTSIGATHPVRVTAHFVSTTSTTITTTSVPTTSITTTTTISTTTTAVCVTPCRRLRTQGPCAGESIPARVDAKIEGALGKLDAAAVGTPKKAKSLTASAGALLAKAGHAALRASKGRHPHLSSQCGQVLSTTCLRVARGG